jgi:hypothetical protein
MERITGPHDGHYVAAYTVSADGVFYGYAKICRVAPRDIWLATALDKVAAGPCATEDAALQAVELRSRQVIGHRQFLCSTQWLRE